MSDIKISFLMILILVAIVGVMYFNDQSMLKIKEELIELRESNEEIVKEIRSYRDDVYSSMSTNNSQCEEILNSILAKPGVTPNVEGMTTGQVDSLYLVNQRNNLIKKNEDDIIVDGTHFSDILP